jgi:hypothetical protein
MFNLYNHWPTLLIRNNDDSGGFLFNREGVTKGDPLVMLGYALGMIPLTRQIKAEFPDVDQPWYADDAEAAAAFATICIMSERLLELGPGYGLNPPNQLS